MPTTMEPTRAQLSGGQVTRHAQGELTTARKTKKASPSTATGMPNTIDCALVVTFSQLIVLLAGQARVTDVRERAKLRTMETPRPPNDRCQVVSWNHSGGPAEGATSAAPARAGAAARAAAGRPFPARPLPCRWPGAVPCRWLAAVPCRWPAAVLASGRPPRVPLSRDWVPLPGLAVAPGLRAAIRARSSRR